MKSIYIFFIETVKSMYLYSYFSLWLTFQLAQRSKDLWHRALLPRSDGYIVTRKSVYSHLFVTFVKQKQILSIPIMKILLIDTPWRVKVCFTYNHHYVIDQQWQITFIKHSQLLQSNSVNCWITIIFI